MATRLARAYSHKFFMLVFFILSIASCTERIDIDLDSTYTRCVIYGELTTDTTAHWISVTRTGDYFKNEPPSPVSGAVVTIVDGENFHNLTEDAENPGNYYTNSDVYGVVGKSYTLFVDGVDLLNDGNLTSYEANSEIKPVASPDSIEVIYQSQWDIWFVNIFAQDPSDTEDFYKFLVYQNGVLHSDSLRSIQVTDDAIFNGSYTNGITVYVVRGDSDDTFSTGDTITVELCGITQDYYKYLIEAQSSARPSVPLFGGPPANPRTNLSNGAIGYFAAYSVSSGSTVIPEDL
ncbi:MAG: DUF4249 family protein [Bacteroidales bacterium]|nr:DUF4249 family protein [Bacteroidales bacterium]MDD4671847.1 DUF4249 family protein [Bacteroidales bacterium]MDY0348852.1 DUF4249 family protein [Tenuifilaceae bacterium]